MTDRDFANGIPVDELAQAGMIAGRLGEDEVLLVRAGDDVYAVGASCPHYHAPLVEGLVVGGTLRCPWHHACFDLATGAVLRAPALAGLPVWRVERRGDRYFIGEPCRAGFSPPEGQGGLKPALHRVVIIGTGAAGVNVAGTLRAEGYEGSIVMLDRDTDLPYDKPNLSKDYLAGNAPAEWLPLHPDTFYEDQRIDLRLGISVSSLDTAAKEVVASDGERLSYDALVLATGCSPRMLNLPGAERVHYLRTRRDAETLVARAASARRAMVIGSSFIGLEVAASLRQKGLEVVVTSPDGVPLERILGPEVGARVQAIHEQHGVVFRLGQTVTEIDADADLVVAGIGVTPNIDLARAAGIDVANGIVVNDYLETSAPGVYACGDVASPPAGRVEHWVVAGRQGQTVARNILGKRERFTAVPFFWSAHYDVVIAYVGHAASWDAIDIHGSLDANDATIVYRGDGDVRAVVTIGRDAVSLAAEEALERGDRRRLEEILAS